MMRRLAAAITKEVRLLGRDLHGLALLFILPLAFILVMSLALQDAFATRSGKGVAVTVIDADATLESKDLIARLSSNPAFTVTLDDSDPTQDLAAIIHETKARFVVVVPADYGETLLDDGSEAAPVRMMVSPEADRRTEMIFLSTLRESLGRHKVDTMLSAMAEAEGDDGDAVDSTALDTPVEVAYAYDRRDDAPPSAVQQSVPAWLVFSIFFVAIPFSNTFITERQMGLHKRLMTTGTGGFTQFVAKLVPYFAINQMQVAMMLAAGAFLVPLLGGDALQLRGSPLALAALSAAISFAALSMALLIATVASTTEQATLTSGIGNIVLAALGGIMVPRFIMPETMQVASQLSPMAWGLDGFLELLLHGGGLEDIKLSLILLGSFGAAMLVLALIIHTRRGAD